MTSNSKTDVCCRIICFLICLELFVFILVSSAKFCYVGMNVNSKEALLNQSCVTNKTHVAESLLATEYNHDIKNKELAQNSSFGLPSVSMEHCYIFRHILSETLSLEIKKEIVRTLFACDFEDVCKGKESNKVIDNVALRGEMGKLFCCDQDNCNSIDEMPQTPAENQICFHGNSSRVSLESCGHPDTYCLTKTQYFKEGKVETYSCDNGKSCDQLDGHGAYNFCQNKEKDNITHEICCCVGNKCNSPSDLSLITKMEESLNPSVIASSTDTWTIVHKVSVKQVKKEDKSKSLVKGLVASIITVGLAGIVLLLVMAYRRKRRRDGNSRRDPNVIMQYERLSCSDASLEGSVSV